MAKLLITPLGSSCRKKFCDELQNMEYGVGAIVLPNRLLLDEVRKNYANVETVGMDTLASKLLNLNGYVTFNQRIFCIPWLKLSSWIILMSF